MADSVSSTLESRRLRPSISRNVRHPEASRTKISSLSLHCLTVASALLASSILSITEADGLRLSLWAKSVLAVTSLTCIGLTWQVRRRMASSADAPFILPLLLAVVLLSLLWEPFQRAVFMNGRPFEMMVMFSQKNLMLALAVVGCQAGYQRLSMLIGVFLAIFCAVVSRDRSVHWMIFVYAVIAVIWLVTNYWDTLRYRLLTPEKGVLPWRWIVPGMALLLLVFMASASSGSTIISAVEGFLPGSGGTGGSDPFARGGVNDGDGLVAGSKDIRSFAPIEDAPFAEDDKPSLYDVFNESFNEPVRKNRTQDRSIALPPEMLADIRQRMAKTEQAGREFSTVRSQRKPDRKRIRSLSSEALFYVAGRVPLHLRFELYDLFDGISWTPEEPSADALPALQMTTLNERPWLRVPGGSRGLDLYSPPETHAVKIINLKSSVIPCPPDTRGIHIDRVDQADMYSLYQEGIVRMNRDSLPELQAIQLMSERVFYEQLQDQRMMLPVSNDVLHLQQPDMVQMESVRKLAAQWTSGIPRGWQQVDAVIQRLRTDYVLDRNTRPSADCEFPVGEFLLTTRRGPEYLFASSAAIMLRSLGYPTRLVSGFYANPERFDSHKRHTPVLAEDAHIWCEISVGARTWLTVEASPGYEILQPIPTFWQRVVQGLKAFLLRALQNWMLVLIAAVVAAVLWRKRQMTADFLQTFWWTVRPAGNIRARVLQTLRLFERRLRYLGLQRPAGMTLNRWIRMQSSLQDVSPALPEFLKLANWAAFDQSDEHSGPDTRQAEICCRRIGFEMTVKACLKSRTDGKVVQNSVTALPYRQVSQTTEGGVLV